MNDKFATEEYDPLLALDKENIEDNVIWQEAPPEVDTIIINTATIVYIHGINTDIDDVTQKFKAL